MTLWWWFPMVLAASAFMTGVLRRYALAYGLMDFPIDRSSHSQPTPRGGGAAIAVAFLVTVAALALFDRVSSDVAGAILGPGTVVALIGFLDDHKSLTSRWRLLSHFVAATGALSCLGGLPPIEAVGVSFDLGWLGDALAVIYLVWLLNLYNFMDGIDGVAGLEAMTVCCGASVLLMLHTAPVGEEWILPGLLAMSAFGFLIWNWPPARIFMGDSGSGFLGLAVGILSIQAAWLGSELWWSWVILLGVFVVDATTTLLCRLWRGERPDTAHHDHAYQHAARCLGAHLPVTITVGAINVVWLLPLAWLVATGRLDGLLGVLIAYLPLVLLAVRFKAGLPQTARYL